MQGFLVGDEANNFENEWSPYKSRLFKARGRIVGGAIIELPGEPAVSEMQLHSAEHRVWCHGMLPVHRQRMATFKILDVFALGHFATKAGDLQANSAVLHPAPRQDKVDNYSADVFEMLPGCVQDICNQY